MSFFKSHLFWFVLIGAAIFLFETMPSQKEKIVIDEVVVSEVSALWAQQMQRPPEKQELQKLLQGWLEDELMYREALAIGLDESDPIIRRRLIQKISFMLEGRASEQPTDDLLLAWFNSRQSQYESPSYVNLRLLPLNGPDAKEAQATLASGLVRTQAEWLDGATKDDLTKAFGGDFAKQVFRAPSNDWLGPIESQSGWYLVLVTDYQNAMVPEFESIRQRVLLDYLKDARVAARRIYLDELNQGYEVEWRIEP